MDFNSEGSSFIARSDTWPFNASLFKCSMRELEALQFGCKFDLQNVEFE